MGIPWEREYQISGKGPGRKKTHMLCYENTKECGLSRKNNRRIIGDEVRSDEPGATHGGSEFKNRQQAFLCRKNDISWSSRIILTLEMVYDYSLQIGGLF